MEIKLRNLKIEDLQEMVAWEENEDPLYYDYNFPQYGKKEQQIWFQSKTKYGKTCLAILQEEKIIGYIAIRKVNPVAKSAEMGIILRPSYQNKGYGTLAIAKMLDWYFNKLGYKKMSLYVGRYNEKALRCYRNLGFKPVKELLLNFNNKEVDLNAEEYQALKRYFIIEGNKTLMHCYKMTIEKPEKKDKKEKK